MGETTKRKKDSTMRNIFFFLRILTWFCFLVTCPATAMKDSLSFLKVTSDKSHAKVFEQIILDVKVYYNGELVDPVLLPPETDKAMVFKLGQVKEQISDDPKYAHVATVRFALFPLHEGLLTIPSLKLSSTVRGIKPSLDLGFIPDNTITNTKEQHTSAASAPIKVSVEKNNGLSACKNLTITASWASNPFKANLGEPLTFEVITQTHNLPAQLIKPVNLLENPAYRVSVKSVRINNISKESGIIGRRITQFQITPQKTGHQVLSSISQRWWNTSLLNISYTKLSPEPFFVTEATSNIAHTQPAYLKNFPPTDNKTYIRSKVFIGIIVLGIIVSGIIWFCTFWLKKAQNQKNRSVKQNEKKLWKLLMKACHSYKLKHIRQSLISWSNSQFIQSRLNKKQQSNINIIVENIDNSLFSMEHPDFCINLLIVSLTKLRKKLLSV